jgi:hypothetical protein
MVLDDGGRPVCVDETVEEIRGQAPDEFIDELRAAAEAAVARRAGGPLEKRIKLTSYSALEWAADLGWLALAGPRKGDVILPDTPVWFPHYTDGVPGDLHRHARGDISYALHALATCVRSGEAVDLSLRQYAPEAGTLATAADLAAGKVPASKRWLEPGWGVRPVAWGVYSTLANLAGRFNRK